MKKKSTVFIIIGVLLFIITLAISNIIEFRLVEFYSMLVLMFFLLKYIYIMKE